MFPKNSLVPSYISSGLLAWALHTPQEQSGHEETQRITVHIRRGAREMCTCAEGVERRGWLCSQGKQMKTSPNRHLSWSQKFTRWRVGFVGRRQSECLHRHEQ